MLKLTKTGIGLLTRQYRSVLHKCFLINLGLWGWVMNVAGAASDVAKNMANTFGEMANVPLALLKRGFDGTFSIFGSKLENVMDDSRRKRTFTKVLTSSTALVTVLTAMITDAEAVVFEDYKNADNTTVLRLEYDNDGGNYRMYNKNGNTTGIMTNSVDEEGELLLYDSTEHLRVSLMGLDSGASLNLYNSSNVISSYLSSSGFQLNGSSVVADGITASVINGSKNLITSGGVYSALSSYLTSATAASTYQTKLSTAQLNAANSGITSTKVNTYDNTSKYFKANADTIDDPANAYGTGSVAIGSNAIAGVSDTDSFATAVGTESSAIGDNSSAFGFMSSASGENSNAIGGSSLARGNASLALGAASTNTIWTYDTTLNKWTGGEYLTPTNGTIAEGMFAQATGNGSIALGYAAIAGEYDTTEDKGDRKDGNQEYRRYVTGAIDNALAIGNYSNASAEYAAALGYGATASAINSVAIGRGSIASVANTISVGSGLDADSETYQYRKIVNVADGVNAHDAATKGQLDTALNNYYTKYGFAGKFMKNDNGISSLAVYENNLSSLAVCGVKSNLSSLAVCGASPRQGISTFGKAASISDIALRKGQIAGRSDAQRTSSDDNIGFAAANDNATITTIAA